MRPHASQGKNRPNNELRASHSRLIYHPLVIYQSVTTQEFRRLNHDSMLSDESRQNKRRY
jgi:hypothetical protein